MEERAIPYTWIFKYLDTHFPRKTESPGYNAIVQMFYDYCKEIQTIEEQVEKLKNL